MSNNSRLSTFLATMLRLGSPEASEPAARGVTNVAGTALPRFGESVREPEAVELTTVVHPDGRMSQYPPADKWDDWVEWDGKLWPQRVARRYMLVPTVCFNCESACGLLAYVDRETLEIRKFEGNPAHPGSRGRNCAKGPATHNQVYDPERILYPLKRVGKRGEGKWKRIPWEQALEEIAAKMRASRQQRRDGIMYHVGRPGEDGYTNRVIQAWGVDGHNSHTNICSSGARAGYELWGGFDRPSPDHASARTILLISSHLETGHYFNPHAQRIIEGKMAGAKLITFDPRLSNTASMSDVWLPTWPGSESSVLLAIANHLLQNDLYDKEFVRRWVNWEETLEAISDSKLQIADSDLVAEIQSKIKNQKSKINYELFDRALKSLYRDFTFERAAEEAQVPVERVRAAAEAVANCGGRLATHTWRSASIGNLGGWQVARCLFFLNVLTGSVGTRGGTSANSWNKFVPTPFDVPKPFTAWNELQMPEEWPLAHYEMSFLLPHFLEEGRGAVDVYFTRVYNPMWINPDGFLWLKHLQNEETIKLPRGAHPDVERVGVVCRLRAADGPRGGAARPDEPGDARGAVDRLPPAGASRRPRKARPTGALHARGQPRRGLGRERVVDRAFRAHGPGRLPRHPRALPEPLPARRAYHGRGVLPLDLREQRARPARGGGCPGAHPAGVHAQIRLLRGHARQLPAV